MSRKKKKKKGLKKRLMDSKPVSEAGYSTADGKRTSVIRRIGYNECDDLSEVLCHDGITVNMIDETVSIETWEKR
jgi:hypothetical protein